MFRQSEDKRKTRFRVVFVTVLSLVVLIGFCLETRKYIIATGRIEVKRYSLVGDFDASYDKLFPRYYHATGLLTLPYDNIVEPFEAWYAGERNMSRIDYYHGMDKTIQRGDMHDHGLLFKLIPKHNGPHPSTKFVRSCWIRKVPPWDPIQGQSVIPTNLSEFKLFNYHRSSNKNEHWRMNRKDKYDTTRFSGLEYHKGFPCQKYVRKIVEYNKTNTYTLYISKNKPYVPVRYEMIGYDDLLTSHYDHYILDYITFSPWTFNFSMFKIPADTWCGRKARKIKSRYLLNPMSEFLHFRHSKDKESDEHFERFKKYHVKDYKKHHENEKRKHIFKHNVRFINSRNRRNIGYKLAINHFGDLTEEEMELHRGLLWEDESEDDGKNETEHIKNERILNLENYKHFDKLPKNLDWRDYGAVSPVSSQGLCGSCWAFAIAGPIEAHHFFQTGKLVEISKQQIIDCTWGLGNNGCRGGFPAKALSWVTKNGVATKKSYGSYLGQEAYCHCGPDDNCTTIRDSTDFFRVKPHTIKAMKVALAKYGPASCSVNADSKTLRFFSHGIYNDPVDSRKRTNHALVCVGYGVEDNGEPYWLLKNTWGPLWGENGFFKMAQNGNIANIQGGLLLTIRKSKDIPEYPYQSLKKLKRKDAIYKNVATIRF